VTAVLYEVRQALVAQVTFEAVANDIGRGDARVGIEPGDILGMIVVPGQPGTLVVGIVMLCLTWLEARIE